jgi:Activator of Hsp90 ATPase homolog 1-like protein
MAAEISAMDNAERESDLVIRKSVTVPLSQRDAFRLFTEGMGTWWPSIAYSVEESAQTQAGMDGRVGGQIFEEQAGGKVTWGTITAWDEPASFTSTWHPGSSVELATQLTVRFIAEGPNTTRVELEHRGWEIHGESARDQFAGYATGWDAVLARYVERAGG